MMGFTQTFFKNILAIVTITSYLVNAETEISNKQEVCSDKLFFEKGHVTSYRRRSRRNGYTRTSTPALDMVIDLQKNGFGTIIYNEEIGDDNVLMLHAYRSNQNLHIYRICPSTKIIEKGNISFNVTGPILKNHQQVMGYFITIKDLHRFNKHLADNYFHIFGEDTHALRKEIWKDREEERKKHQDKNSLNGLKALLSVLAILLVMLSTQPSY